MARGTHESFREWILGTVVDWFWRFARSIPTTSDDSITAVVKLRYHESAPSSAAPCPAQTPSASPLSQSSAQPEPEVIIFYYFIFQVKLIMLEKIICLSI